MLCQWTLLGWDPKILNPADSLRNTICMWISPSVKITIGHGHEKEIHLLNYKHFLGVQRQCLRRYMHYLGATWAWFRLFLFNGTWHGPSIAAKTMWELTQPTNSRIFQDERSFNKQTLKLTVTKVCLWKYGHPGHPKRKLRIWKNHDFLTGHALLAVRLSGRSFAVSFRDCKWNPPTHYELTAGLYPRPSSCVPPHFLWPVRPFGPLGPPQKIEKLFSPSFSIAMPAHSSPAWRCCCWLNPWMLPWTASPRLGCPSCTWWEQPVHHADSW